MTKKGKSARCLDTASVASEAEWYRAEEDWETVRSHCKAWNGIRDLSLVSVFDRSKRICKMWEDHGHKAEAYDIAHHEIAMDICSRVGFFTLLNLLLRLVPNGFSFWAPPCSMWIFLTSSLHQRHVYGYGGDLKQFSVRLANRMAANACVALKAALKFRASGRAMLEQPSGSWLFKGQLWQDVISGFFLKRSLTYQGLFGGPLPKPTHLLHSLTSDELFARKLTKKLRQKKKFNSNRQKVFYIKDSNGSVHGTKMLTSTSIYPKRFAAVIYKAWEQHSK